MMHDHALHEFNVSVRALWRYAGCRSGELSACSSRCAGLHHRNRTRCRLLGITRSSRQAAKHRSRSAAEERRSPNSAGARLTPPTRKIKPQLPYSAGHIRCSHRIRLRGSQVSKARPGAPFDLLPGGRFRVIPFPTRSARLSRPRENAAVNKPAAPHRRRLSPQQAEAGRRWLAWIRFKQPAKSVGSSPGRYHESSSNSTAKRVNGAPFRTRKRHS
jgi:hypothetical protein